MVWGDVFGDVYSLEYPLRYDMETSGRDDEVWGYVNQWEVDRTFVPIHL